jgi:glycosyltransferase involved in cell wall biosynthesis
VLVDLLTASSRLELPLCVTLRGMSRTTYPVTLMVIARNEAASIGRCLDSVPFAAEKVVVDSGSEDGTQQVAAAHGARVVQHEWLGFGPQRNFAATQASNDWILVLDADEALTPQLAEELQRRLPELLQSSAIAGAVLRRRTWYMGAPMRWYRPMVGERLVRFYHRGRGRWSNARVHETLQLDGPVAELREPFEHHHNPTLVHRHLKILRYSELKARDWLERGRPVRLWAAPLIFIAAFIKDYFLRLGFLDGWRGYVVSQVGASYAVYKRLRYFEMKHHPASRELAAQLLHQYGLDP